MENTVGKGEIARYEQFLLFPRCFQKTCKNQGLFGKGLKLQKNIVGKGENAGYQNVFFYPKCFQAHTTAHLGRSINSTLHNPNFVTTTRKGPFEKIVRKGENASYQHFLLFPQCFLSFPKQIQPFEPSLTHSHTMTPFDTPGKQAFR